MNLKLWVAGFAIWIASLFGVWYFFPKTETVISYETAKVDETVWVRRSVYVSERDLNSRLRRENADLAKKAKDIDLYNRIIADLNLEIDQLSKRPVPIPLPGTIRDTTITITATFGDELFSVQSKNVFNNNELFDTLNITQLRPIVIDVATKITDDNKAVYTYVSSPDFKDMRVETYTTIKPKRLKWYHWLGAGVAGGIITWEIIR